MDGTVAGLQAFTLERLKRFARLAAASSGAAGRLARHAALSAYRDCLALGLRQRAEAVLDSVARESISAR